MCAFLKRSKPPIRAERTKRCIHWLSWRTSTPKLRDAPGNAHESRDRYEWFRSIDCILIPQLVPIALTRWPRWRSRPEGRLLTPIDHADSAHLYLSGTGLTHLGSAASRDKMHRTAAGEDVTDSMRMFRMGVEGGKPQGEAAGVQPEWFYKGDGSNVVATDSAICAPAFALDGSEEPEIAGIYIVDPSGTPQRLGYCLANEFSDHIMERGYYLWLAHSKLRPAALTAEEPTGALTGIGGVDTSPVTASVPVTAT
jgi:hypothetical protein